MAHIQKYGNRQYRVRYRDPSGSERSRSFKRRSDAQRFLTEIDNELARGSWVDPRSGRKTLAEFSREVMVSKINLRPSTRSRDESHLRTHIAPEFGAVALARIDRRSVQAWVRKLSDEKGLAPRTVRECYRILGGIMSEAVHHKLINESPCYRMTLPRVERVEKVYLTPQQVETLADAIDPSCRALAYVGAYLGLRWGELAGLKRENVNLLKRQVKIVGSLERDGNGYRYSENLKSKATRRTLPLPRFLADILAEHLAAAPDSEFVFPAAGGGFLRYHNWRRRVWLPAVESAGLEGVTPHALRHTCAAILINSEANPILVQRRLGHANISITLDTYGHLFPNQDDALTDHLDDVFAETKSTQAAASSRHDVVELKATKRA